MVLQPAAVLSEDGDEEEDHDEERAEEAEEVISYHMGFWILHIRDTFAD